MAERAGAISPPLPAPGGPRPGAGEGPPARPAWPRAAGHEARRRRRRIGLTAAAALCFVIALLRPGFVWPVSAGSTLLVVDITQSMNVVDESWDGRPVTRLEYTRSLLRRVLRELPCGHRIGAGVFTERKTIVLVAPLEVCAHQAALDEVLGGIDWRMAWAADSHLYYGVYSALDELQQRWPGASLAFFSDGHQAPVLFPGREPRYERRPDSPQGYLFGVGGQVPQPVPRLDAGGRIGGYWTADDAAGFASPGAPTLGVAEMERQAQLRAQGKEERNAAQRPSGATEEHLSGRRDAVLQDVAEHAGLAVRQALDAAGVVADLRSLPSSHTAPRRIEAHDAAVVLGALALLAALWPGRRTGRRAAAAGRPARVPPT